MGRYMAFTIWLVKDMLEHTLIYSKVASVTGVFPALFLGQHRSEISDLQNNQMRKTQLMTTRSSLLNQFVCEHQKKPFVMS